MLLIGAPSPLKNTFENKGCQKEIRKQGARNEL